jgi:hypothetical protein
VHYHAFTLGLYRQVFKEMQRRRDEIDDDDREVNRDAAAKKGWRSVFAGGRYDTESGGEKRGWTKEDTIPFVSTYRTHTGCSLFWDYRDRLTIKRMNDD